MKHQCSLARFEEEERRRRAAVVAEFGGDTDAMAGEILRCREALNKLADAAALARAGEPFGLIYPGPTPAPNSREHATVTT